MKKRSIAFIASVTLLGLALSACTEKPQTIRKSDTKSWDATATGYTQPGFTPGNADAWEAQMRKRAQAQNEYARASSQSSTP